VILTIETKHPEAEGLSYLLHKHPARLQSFTQSFGRAWVFYPIAVPGHTKVAVFLDVDPVALVRRKGRPAGDGFSLGQYVNDRGYAACSFLSVALADMFGSALNGKCKDKPEMVDVAFPFVVSLPAVPCRAGGEFLHQLFEPLGYSLEVTPLPLDEKFPDWEMSQCFKLTLRATLRLRDLLTHLYVLIPVLDNDKHYWVGQDEVEKLLQRGEGWLPGHPLKEKIVHRYLKYQKQLTTPALEILAEDEVENPDEVLEEQNTEEERIERDLSLHEQRLGTVLATLKSSGASRILDLGCGEGKLLRLLLKENQFTKIVGMDVSHRALERAAEKLKIERMPDFQKARVHRQL
jgi:3' terminal RNA ribose 2'-O-methyltransferase Hen1